MPGPTGRPEVRGLRLETDDGADVNVAVLVDEATAAAVARQVSLTDATRAAATSPEAAETEGAGDGRSIAAR